MARFLELLKRLDLVLAILMMLLLRLLVKHLLLMHERPLIRRKRFLRGSSL